MKRWLRRIACLLLAGLGAASLLMPWSTSRRVRMEASGAHLRPLGRIAPEAGSLPAGWIPVGDALLAQLPHLAALLREHVPGWRDRRGLPSFATLPGDEVLVLLEATGSHDTGLDLLYAAHRVRLEGLVPAAVRVAAGSDPERVSELHIPLRIAEITPLLEPPPDTLALALERLPALPALTAALDGELALDRRLAGYPEGFLSREELWPLVRDDGTLPESVAVGDRLFRLEAAELSVEGRVPVEGLASRLRMLGLAALALGLVAGIGLYRSRPVGIPLASTGMVLVGDVVLGAFALLSWIPVIDAVLAWRHGTDSLMAGEELLVVSGAAVLALGIPVGAAHGTALAAQALDVDGERLRLSTWAGERVLAWRDLQAVDTSTSWILVGRVGWLMPRKYQSRLVLRGHGQALKLMEPTGAVKRRILAALERHAPEQWRSRIAAAGADWR